MSRQNDEAERIYNAIFSKDMPPEIRQHFLVLSKKIEDRFADKDVKKYSDIIKKVGDLEAVELAGRYLKRLPILSLKFKIMFFLAETLQENYDEYINREDNILSGYLLLTASVLRSLFKFSKGVLLLAFHRP